VWVDEVELVDIRTAVSARCKQKVRGGALTYLYSDTSQHEALYNAARKFPGGIDGLANALSARLGKRISPNVLRNKLRPGIDTHHITLEDFSLVLELCEEARVESALQPLDAVCWRHGRVAVEVPEVDPNDPNPARTVCQVMAKVGAVAEAVAKAAADGVIDERELDEIEAVFFRAQAALASWHAEIRVQAEAQARKR